MTASDIDHIINHLSLRKSRNRWRWLAVILAIIGIIALIAAAAGPGPRGDHVARLRIDGLITGSQAGLDLLRDVAEDDAAKAVILRIDSPGGTTAGSEALYEAIRDVAEKKPVVTVMDTVAASGGYIAALATDRIYARGNTITGSIGVIFTFPEVSRLLETVGVKIEEIKSGDLKAEPSPYKPVSDKARAYALVMVEDGFRWFKGLVAERRKLDAAKVDVLADGRVFTGRQAKAEGLIDELGGEDEALAWLKAEKGIAASLKVEEWQPPKPFAERMLGASVASLLGLGDLEALAARAKLDGLLVLWQPSASAN
ncbi:MAG: signal peptide peptidase SppA [Proteobacteria bacterium]|nr:signal peptide peptidase SppA [Pseudomonadota bacterium]